MPLTCYFSLGMILLLFPKSTVFSEKIAIPFGFFFFFLEVVFAGNWHLSEGCIYPCVCGMGCKQSLSCCFPEGATK